MKIESRRLLLYPISNDEIRRLIEETGDAGLKQAYQEMLDGCLREPERRIWYAVWYMEQKQQPGIIVGDLCFKGLHPDGMVELGYGLREGYCGQGYMTEAVRAVSEWALTQTGVTRVESETEPENRASQKVLLRSGFTPTGTEGEEGPRFVYRNHRQGNHRQGAGMDQTMDQTGFSSGRRSDDSRNTAGE